jgi:glycosyltransferase involved in cell wall biosynthesis
VNLLLFNLRTDVSDATHGFTTGWINALAKYCDRITVVTMHTGDVEVDSNVEVLSLGKERGFSEPRRLLRFYRLVLDVVRNQKIDVAFAHMAPLFAALFAPVAKAKKIPILLWYAHRSVPVALRVAERVVDECVAPTPESFRLASEKVSFIGHGIDTALFTPPAAPHAAYEHTAVTVGRLSRIKNVHEIIEGVARVRGDRVSLDLEVTGGPSTPDDLAYDRDIRSLVERLGLSTAVTFTGPVPFTEVGDRYRRAGLFVNLCESALDKAILESMASGCIPICRNGAFRTLAEENGFLDLVPGWGADSVAICIRRALEMPASAKRELRDRLRQVVVDDHSLAALSETVAARLRRLSHDHARD